MTDKDALIRNYAYAIEHEDSARWAQPLIDALRKLQAEVRDANKEADKYATETIELKAEIKRLTEDLTYANAELLRYSSCLYGGNPDCPARPADFEDVPGATARPPLAGKQKGFETLGPSLQADGKDIPL